MRAHRTGWAALSCVAALAAAVLLTVGPAGAASAPGTTWDTQAQFNAGTLNNTVTTAVGDGEVRLSDETQAFPFIWVALSNRGTIAKIDTVTGHILGEYRSAPDSVGYPNPSRTTVIRDGSVWSGNRSIAAAVHVGIVETGQCVDRNGNGTIETSTGYGDVLAWPGGDVSTAADECILNYVPTYGGDARHMSVDGDGEIWVGNYSDTVYPWRHRFFRIDSSTGAILRTVELPCGGYGGLVDAAGVLWSSTSGYQLLRWDPSTDPSAARCISVPVYGVAEDSLGNIWVSNYGYDDSVRKISPDGNTITPYSTHRPAVPYAQGLAVSHDSLGRDHVWVSSSLSGGANTIAHLLGDGTWIGNVTGAGRGSTGVAVDAAGKIWTANIESSDATRINPDAGPLGTGGIPVGAFDLTVPLPASPGLPVANPYNYSDMTGSSLKGAPDSGTWTAIYDSGTAGAEWGTLSWNADVPAGASMTVSVAAGDDSGSLGTGATAANGVRFIATGRYVKVTVVMNRAPGGEALGSPVLEDLTLLPANRPPVANAGTDQTKSEGDLVTLDGSASSDPDGDPITYGWESLPGYTGPAVALSDPSAANPSFATTDNGLYTFRLTVTDDKGASSSDEVQVTVGNVDPAITNFTAPATPVPVSQPVVLSAQFTDPGTADTHTASFALDGMTQPGSVTETNGSGGATASFSVTVPGVYTATVTVTDDDGGTDTETALVPVVVYDPDGGFVTGGGWIMSPAGAYAADANLSGKATFGFVSKYQKGASEPSGNTEFSFQTAGLKFKSTSYDWLVVAGAKAQFKGVGEVNGVAGYKFMLTAVDGQIAGGGGADKFRIKIWNDAGTVYDNQNGADDSAPLSTELAGGSIVIHK